MLALLDAILQDVHAQGGALTVDQAGHYMAQYRAVLDQAERECPLPISSKNGSLSPQHPLPDSLQMRSY